MLIQMDGLVSSSAQAFDTPVRSASAPASIAKAASAPEVVAAAPNASEVKAAVVKANQIIQAIPQALEFEIDPDTKSTVIKLIDTQNQSVIRQFPSEEMLNIAKALDHLQGLLVRDKA